MTDQKFLESMDNGLGPTPQTENINLLPEHRKRELRYMKRLSKRHLSTWPSKKTFPRYKV